MFHQEGIRLASQPGLRRACAIRKKSTGLLGGVVTRSASPCPQAKLSGSFIRCAAGFAAQSRKLVRSGTQQRRRVLQRSVDNVARTRGLLCTCDHCQRQLGPVWEAALTIKHNSSCRCLFSSPISVSSPFTFAFIVLPDLIPAWDVPALPSPERLPAQAIAFSQLAWRLCMD